MVKDESNSGPPWWIFAAVALIAVEYHEALIDGAAVSDHQPTALRRHSPLRGVASRRLVEDTEEDGHDEDTEVIQEDEDRELKGETTLQKGKKALQKGKNTLHKMHHIFKRRKFQLTIPCLSRPILGWPITWKPTVTPCGNITVGEHRVAVHTIFGTSFIPGASDIKPHVERFEDFMSEYTIAFTAIVAILMLIRKFTTDRAKTMQQVKDIWSGDLDPPEEGETAEERAQQQKDRMNPDTEDFVAPGNIYRCLAVFHPGHYGYVKWLELSFKALVAAYMQLYIPYKIMFRILGDWKLLGVKSPLWFMSNIVGFISMMTALLSLCNMFAGKCGNNILVGAEANFYILSHCRPRRPEGYTAVTGEAAAAPDPDELAPRWLIVANEYFWCCASMIINTCMSFMLQLAMFLKVATFTGAVENVAVVAVSLYFVFDLDKKVLETDPKLKLRYRRAVLQQTQLRTYQPTWLNSLALLCISLLNASVPFGLLSIILLSFKNADLGIVIGGDGLTRK